MSDLITSLINLAERRSLADYGTKDLSRHPAFASRPVNWVLDLDSEGNSLQLSRTTGRVIWDPNERKWSPAGAKQFSLPVRYWLGSLNQDTPPQFLFGKIEDFFPATLPKPITRHKPWMAIRRGARLKSLNPVWQFLARERPTFAKIKQLASAEKPRGSDVFTFRVAGRVAAMDPDVRQWWACYHTDTQRAGFLDDFPEGTEILNGNRRTKIALKYPLVFGRTPLASFNRAQFRSYGLGPSAAGLSIVTAEKIAAAVEALRHDESSAFSYESNVFLFWATEEGSGRQLDCSFVALMARPDPLAVRDFFNSTFAPRGKQFNGEFSAVALRNEQGRFHVRSCLGSTLAEAQEHAARYFQAIEVRAPEGKLPRMRYLAECLALPLKPNARKETRDKHAAERARDFARLVETALFGRQVPQAVLAQAVARQRAEVVNLLPSQSEWQGSDSATGQFQDLRADGDGSRGDELGQDPVRRLIARAAVIQLYFHATKTQPLCEASIMSTSSVNPADPCNDPAVLLGRLLAILDNIHCEAHAKTGKNGRPIYDRRGIGVSTTNTSPATRMYSAASATPALAFPQLCKVVVYHMASFRERQIAEILGDGLSAEDTPEGYSGPYEGLSQIVSRLKRQYSERGVAVQFPRTLSLEDQGKFALGFYYERSRVWPRYKRQGLRGSEPIEASNIENQRTEQTP
jgi:hypothetical protein